MNTRSQASGPRGEIGRDGTLLSSGISRRKPFDRRNLFSDLTQPSSSRTYFSRPSSVSGIQPGILRLRIVIGDDRIFSLELLRQGTHFLIVVRDSLRWARPTAASTKVAQAMSACEENRGERGSRKANSEANRVKNPRFFLDDAPFCIRAERLCVLPIFIS